MNIDFRKYQAKPKPSFFEITEDNNRFRTYSPSYSIPQNHAAEIALELADGVDPLHLTDYSAFMETATGVENDGYSVSIPGFITGDPDIDNVNADPDPYLLGLLNVKYVVSNFQLEVNGLDLVQSSENKYYYLNQYWLPRAWIEERPVQQEQAGQIDRNLVVLQSWTPNKITLAATGPGRLILSEIVYPGWLVFIDGIESSIEPAYQVLRSVNIPEGVHEVVFQFRPIRVYIGFGFAVVGWAISLWQISKSENSRII
jgi:hypothetical protein